MLSLPEVVHNPAMNIFVLLLLRLFSLIPGRFWFSISVQDYNISNDLAVLLLLVNRVLLSVLSSITACRLFFVQKRSAGINNHPKLIQNAVTREPWPVTSVLISSNSSVKHKKLGFIYKHNTKKCTILNSSPISAYFGIFLIPPWIDWFFVFMVSWLGFSVMIFSLSIFVKLR